MTSHKTSPLFAEVVLFANPRPVDRGQNLREEVRTEDSGNTIR